nr:hypothetical protein [Pandoravirus massiliensis]
MRRCDYCLVLDRAEETNKKKKTDRKGYIRPVRTADGTAAWEHGGRGAAACRPFRRKNFAVWPLTGRAPFLWVRRVHGRCGRSRAPRVPAPFSDQRAVFSLIGYGLMNQSGKKGALWALKDRGRAEKGGRNGARTAPGSSCRVSGFGRVRWEDARALALSLRRPAAKKDAALPWSFSSSDLDLQTPPQSARPSNKLCTVRGTPSRNTYTTTEETVRKETKKKTSRVLLLCAFCARSNLCAFPDPIAHTLAAHCPCCVVHSFSQPARAHVSHCICCRAPSFFPVFLLAEKKEENKRTSRTHSCRNRKNHESIMSTTSTPTSRTTNETETLDDVRAQGTKRTFDEFEQAIAAVTGASDDDDFGSDSARSLTSSSATASSKRARGDILAPDGSVVRSVDSSVEDDPVYRSQLLQLVASATNSNLDTTHDTLEFSLTIDQPAVFREMIESVSTMLDDQLPVIVISGSTFGGVRIRGMEKTKTCYVRAQFSCSHHYVSAIAIANNGGRETRAEGVGVVERVTRYHVSTKITKACLNAVPKSMCMRVVKSSKRAEIVFGCYDGPSSKRQDMACVPTLEPQTSVTDQDEAGGAADDDSDPAQWDVEVVCAHDIMFAFPAEMLRSALAPATALDADEVTFSVREPREQRLGRRPANVRHAVLMVSVKGKAASGYYSKPFYATSPWTDAGAAAANAAGHASASPSTPLASMSSTQDAGPQPSPASAASTPQCYTVSADADGSMSTELESTVEECYSVIYDVKKMITFLKGIRGTVEVSLGQGMPISIAHGNNQYRVEMIQAPKTEDDTRTA